VGARPRLVLISEDSPSEPRLSEFAALLPHLFGIVDVVVLRWRWAPAHRVLESARRLAEVQGRPRLILSERFDLAQAARLDGVQLPETGLPAQDVRRCWPDALIGVSRHDASGVADRSAGADFVLLGAVFATKSKPGAVPLGIETFAQITSAAVGSGCSAEVLALGGVDLRRVPGLIRAGAAGVAVRSAILDARDPVEVARRFRSALDAA
jgi:thiamine-phosphate diphosphorylase